MASSGKKQKRGEHDESFYDIAMGHSSDDDNKRQKTNGGRTYVSLPSKTASELIQISAAYLDTTEATVSKEITNKISDAVFEKLTREDLMGKIPNIMEHIRRKQCDDADTTEVKTYIDRARRGICGDKAEDVVTSLVNCSRSELLARKKAFEEYIVVTDFYLAKLNITDIAIKVLPKILNRLFYLHNIEDEADSATTPRAKSFPVPTHSSSSSSVPPPVGALSASRAGGNGTTTAASSTST